MTLDKNVSLYGGFSGSENRREERDASVFSVFDNAANLVAVTGKTVTFDHLTFKNSTNRALRIDSGSDVTLNYCVFVKNAFSGTYGGGVYVNGALLTMNGCVFDQNGGSTYGGAVYANTSTVNGYNCVFSKNYSSAAGGALGTGNIPPILLVLDNCTFIGNKSTSGAGGAISTGWTSSFIMNCTFSGNQASSSSGGAVDIDNWCISSIINCVFDGNTASAGGGGLYVCNNASATIEGCQFTNNTNTTSYGGGGLYSLNSNVSMNACSFSGNTSTTSGGGIYLSLSSAYTFLLKNSVFTSNSSGVNGGGIYFVNNTATHNISGLTFYNNIATGSGGAVYQPGVIPLYNSVFYGNTAGSGSSVFNNSGTMLLYNCAYSSGSLSAASYSLTGCIALTEIPFLSTDSSSAYYLRPASILVNAGTNSPGFDILSTDLAGKTRIVNGIVDIGAYERP